MLLWMLMMLLLLPGAALGNTRLGLHTTQDELDIWRQRAANGPYKSTGDVSTNSPGDWDRISANAIAFQGSPLSEIWAGNTGTTCWTGSQHDPPTTWVRRMRDAAFKALITATGPAANPTDSADLKAKAKNWILTQRAQVGTDFTNTVRWCAQNSASDYMFSVAEWVMVILYAMDYLEILDPNTFSAGEKTSLQNWFVAFGTMANSSIRGALLDIFPGRESDNYTPAVGTDTPSAPVILYHEANGTAGPSANSKALRYWANKKNTMAASVALIGVRYNVSDFKTHMTRYGQEVLRYSVWPQGVTTDFFRCYDTPTSPERALGYAGTIVGQLVTIADVFARNGDPALYNYTTSGGIYGSEGGTKTVKFAVETLMKYVDHTYDRYCTEGASGTQAGNADYRIDDQWSNLNCSGCLGKQSLRSLMLVPANNFYKSTYIKGVYRRNGPGMIAFPTLANSINGSYEMQGVTQTLPGVLFMFGDMADNQVAHPGLDPYLSTDLVAPSPPSVLTITSSTTTTVTFAVTRPTTQVGGGALTDFAGYRIEGCSGSPTCPLVFLRDILTAAFTSTGPDTWTEPGLTPDTLYRFQVKALDTTGNFSAASNIASDTTDAPPAATPVVYWRFDESGATTTAQDDTINNYDGLLCEGTTCTPVQGPTWVAGQVNNAISCNLTNDNVQVTHQPLLDMTGDLTIAFWLRLQSTTNVSTNAVILTKESPTGNFPAPYHLELVNAADPYIRYYHWNVTSGAALNFTNLHIPTTTPTWQHITFTRNTQSTPKLVRLYVNGNFTQELSYTNPPATSSAALRLCVDSLRGATRYAHIALDETRLYNSVLSDDQIASLAGQAPGATPVLAQASWCAKAIDALETDTCHGPVQTQGSVVVNNQVQLRTAIVNTGDTSPLSSYALYCRQGAGTWWPLDGDCIANPLCYGFSTRRESGESTAPQLTIGGATFLTGGKFYEVFGSTADMVAIGADQYIEREHALRTRSDVAEGTTFGCCERYGDGTVLEGTCQEATMRVVAPYASIGN